MGIVNTDTVPATPEEWQKALTRLINLAKAHDSGDSEAWMRQHPDEEVGGPSKEVLDIITAWLDKRDEAGGLASLLQLRVRELRDEDDDTAEPRER
jgi:hypothetical protein